MGIEYIILGLLIIIFIQLQAVVFHTHLQRFSGNGKPVFVDTSALMDGRIITAANTGFIKDQLIVPKSVIAELQLLADTADTEKRVRARRGLDGISELQALTTTSVKIMDDGKLDEGGVDARLVTLAKKYNGMVCTIDFNLNKVAKAENIFVLNVNELAQSLRMAFLPGERISINLVQKGQDSHQAVGYLADGTMVVVEHAARSIGQQVEVEFIRSLQTAAGRMMFARPTGSDQETGRPTVKDRTKTFASNETRRTKPAKQTTSSQKKKSSGEDSLMKLVNGQNID